MKEKEKRNRRRKKCQLIRGTARGKKRRDIPGRGGGSSWGGEKKNARLGEGG